MGDIQTGIESVIPVDMRMDIEIDEKLKEEVKQNREPRNPSLLRL